VNAWLDLDALLATPDRAVLDRFEGTPLRRPGAVGLKRNALIVLGNLGDPGAVPAIRAHGLVHADPVVRGAAVWALSRLGERVVVSGGEHPLVKAEAEACSAR
jgi:epoxyqueuosine reductase